MPNQLTDKESIDRLNEAVRELANLLGTGSVVMAESDMRRCRIIRNQFDRSEPNPPPTAFRRFVGPIFPTMHPRGMKYTFDHMIDCWNQALEEAASLETSRLYPSGIRNLKEPETRD